MNAIVAVALFVGLFAFYVHSRVSIQTDSIWSIPTAASLLHDGDTNLDEFRPTLRSYTAHGTREVGGHTYFEYPLGSVLVAAPLLALYDSVSPHFAGGAWHERFHQTGTIDLGQFAQTEEAIASLCVAAAAVVLFLALRRRYPMAVSVSAVVLFALGTSAYSTASRVLWQHGPSMLCLSLVVWAVTAERQTRLTAAVAGFAVAFSYVCRPTNAVSVVGITVLYVWKWRRELPAFFASAALVAVPFCAYTFHTYHWLFSPYYAQPLKLSPSVPEALLANLISPARGLFVFSPFFLGVAVFVIRVARRGTLTPAEKTLLSILLIHWVAISSFAVWWAGHSIGPRFFTDVLPYAAWFTAGALEQVASSRKPMVIGAWSAAALLSVFIHWRASNSFAVHHWNDGPPNVDDAPERVWNVHDAQVMRVFKSSAAFDQR